MGVFYTYRSDTCLELDLKSVQFGSQAPGLSYTPLARSFDERHQSWRAALPKDSSDLWEALDAFDDDSRAALFAHCVSLSVNAVHEAWNRRPKAFAHADRLAQVVDLDLAASWTPTAANFLGRVTKARILQAVAEGERKDMVRAPAGVGVVGADLETCAMRDKAIEDIGRFARCCGNESIMDGPYWSEVKV